MYSLVDLQQMKKWKLIKLVTEEFVAMRNDPEYVCDMNTFHSRIFSGKVHCCFAGCLLRLLGIDEHPYASRGQDYYPLMMWLEVLRLGLLSDLYPDMSKSTYLTIFGKDKVIKADLNNPDEFVKAMFTVSARLEIFNV